MHDRIKKGANLLDDHVFQFDFLNDDFTKLLKPLQEIINIPKKQKKLVIYINPPYAEGDNVRELDEKMFMFAKYTPNIKHLWLKQVVKCLLNFLQGYIKIALTLFLQNFQS